MPDRGDGACGYLGEDDLCMIYETRPIVCRIDELHQLTHPRLSEQEYYQMTADFCNKLMESQGIGDEFLVEIES